MRITRVKLNKPSKDTHEWRPYKAIWEKYALEVLPMKAIYHDFELAIDPFARNCDWAYPYTNDLNIDTLAKNHLDAEAYLEMVRDYATSRFGIALLDPPFSDRMSKDKYGTSNLYSSDSGKMTRIQKLAGDLVLPGGYIVKAGYNSSRPHPCFDLVEMRVVCLGAIQNDVIFTVWRKMQHTLKEVV